MERKFGGSHTIRRGSSRGRSVLGIIFLKGPEKEVKERVKTGAYMATGNDVIKVPAGNLRKLVLRLQWMDIDRFH